MADLCKFLVQGQPAFMLRLHVACIMHDVTCHGDIICRR